MRPRSLNNICLPFINRVSIYIGKDINNASVAILPAVEKDCEEMVLRNSKTELLPNEQSKIFHSIFLFIFILILIESFTR